ncbi:hypothetical protein SLITO_v1c02460 [Spiroplasma litorale]|uniref:Uncharacterized protein n=1 Tax=Spiroplasma litorale TaxID=216942 RepID=A0A0K1W1D5_9MOLU|nr:hypothetical protein [Spiroplasma litorale]AKX33902.1 hypothetical protein SLITO_v1c02460 [Spiroplasma litorale]
MKFTLYNELVNQIIPLTITFSFKDIDIDYSREDININSFSNILNKSHPVTAINLLRSFKFYYKMFVGLFLKDNEYLLKDPNSNIFFLSHKQILKELEQNIATFENKILH